MSEGAHFLQRRLLRKLNISLVDCPARNICHIFVAEKDGAMEIERERGTTVTLIYFLFHFSSN